MNLWRDYTDRHEKLGSTCESGTMECLFTARSTQLESRLEFQLETLKFVSLILSYNRIFYELAIRMVYISLLYGTFTKKREPKI